MNLNIIKKQGVKFFLSYLRENYFDESLRDNSDGFNMEILEVNGSRIGKYRYFLNLNISTSHSVVFEYYGFNEENRLFERISDEEYSYIMGNYWPNFFKDPPLYSTNSGIIFDLDQKKRKAIKRVNENKMNKNNTILYYSFDWDDNILFMPSKIKVWDENKEILPISTEQYAKYRSYINEENPVVIDGRKVISMPKTSDGEIDFDLAFSDFRDSDGENLFLRDSKEAIRLGKLGPSWDDFIECLTTGSIFSIITARGHEKNTIRECIEFIINNELNYDDKLEMYFHLLKNAYLNNIHENYPKFPKKENFTDNELIKDYLDLCEYIGVSAPSRKSVNGAMSPEELKRKALLEFKQKVNRLTSNIGATAKIGFSDDDQKTVKNIEDLYDNLNHEEFPNIIEYVVKNTSDPDNIKKRVIQKFEDVSSKPDEFRLNTLKNFNHFNKDQMGGMEIFSPRVNTEINRINDEIFDTDEVEDENGDYQEVSLSDKEDTGLVINKEEPIVTPETTLDYPYGFGKNPGVTFRDDSRNRSNQLVIRFADWTSMDTHSPGSMTK